MGKDVFERVRAAVGEIDPLAVEASAEVDESLLDWALGLTPRERLRACTRATRALLGFRRVSPQPG